MATDGSAGGSDGGMTQSRSRLKLRGAVDRVLSDSRTMNPPHKNLWTEVAQAMKNATQEQQRQHAEAVKAGEDTRGSKTILRSVYQHLETAFNQSKSTDQDVGLRVEDFLQLQHLQRVKALFENHRPESHLNSPDKAAPGGGGGGRQRRRTRRPAGSLNVTEFQSALNKIIGSDKFSEQLERVFYKLDTDNSGSVSWTEFSNYMMLYLNERNRLTSRVEPPFKADPKLRHVLYNKQEPTARLLLTESPTRPISVSKTGCIMLWDCTLKLESHMDTQNAPSDVSGGSTKRMFNEWVIDCVYMDNCHKLVLSTTGRELKFYDIASNVIKEEYVLYGLKSVPTTMKFFYKKEAANIDSHLYTGDDAGNLSLYVFKKPMFQLFDIPPDPNHLSQRVWHHELSHHTKYVDYFHYEGIHSEPINDMAYLAENKCMVTCSSAPSNSVVIYDLKHRRPLYTFKLRRGAECFDISRNLNLLVTGSHDHLVRFWNPYVPSKHTALLEGHNNSVLSVKIHEKHGYVLSYARDGVIKAWDVKAYVCVQSVTVRIPYSVADKLPEHMGSPLTLHLSSNTVYLTCSDNIVQYRLGKEADPVPGLVLTHKSQLCSALYNPVFRQVTTASDDSSMLTWDLETGNKCLAFADAHKGEEVTCLAYDATCRRLFTGSRHGGMRVWNFQTGQMLHELERTADAEITGMVPIPMQRRILAVGWNREIAVYKDSNPEESLRPAVEWKGGIWHEDDILTCDFCPPDLLATASYDGAILVWNVDHEKLYIKLRDGFQETVEKKLFRAQGITPPPTRSARSRRGMSARPNSRQRSFYQAPSRSPAPVDKLIFLKRRANDKRHRESGFLLTSEVGRVRFWSVHGPRHEVAAFHAAVGGETAGECVLAMASNRKDTALITGDTAGHVRCWSIANYGLFQRDKPETNPPHCLHEFRAHEAAIVSVDFAEIDTGDFVVTASVDCTAKLFSVSGEAVGTFGQPKPWDISQRKSWRQAQIDRQKFFEQEVGPIPEESGVEAERLEHDDAATSKPEFKSVDSEKLERGVDNSLKIRSQTMPALDSLGYKPLIGAKAEKDFERMRLSRTDRRHEFGATSTQMAVAPGTMMCSPYTVLKTTEFKVFTLSENLPQPSWRAHRSKTTLTAAAAQPDGDQSASSREDSGGESSPYSGGQPMTDREANQRQVRFPPIAATSSRTRAY